jgi:hypothetical protein
VLLLQRPKPAVHATLCCLTCYCEACHHNVQATGRHRSWACVTAGYNSPRAEHSNSTVLPTTYYTGVHSPAAVKPATTMRRRLVGGPRAAAGGTLARRLLARDLAVLCGRLQQFDKNMFV